MATANEMERLISLLNEKEKLLKERELALDDQQEEFQSQKEELHAAIEELMAKNEYLTSTLDQLKQRNSELDQILYRASHDLKTPVSSIFGLISIMQSGGVTEEQQAVLHHLSQKTHQMEQLLMGLSDLSTAFFHQPQFEPCSVQSVLELALKNIKADHQIVVDSGLSNVWLTTDVALLKIILTCIIKNAVDFSLPNVPNHIQIKASGSTSLVSIEVSDTGEEIPPAMSEKIFGMFFRGSVRSTGPGLGLYIAQRAVEKLKGKIELVSENGPKKFIITLPVSSDPQ